MGASAGEPHLRDGTYSVERTSLCVVFSRNPGLTTARISNNSSLRVRAGLAESWLLLATATTSRSSRSVDSPYSQRARQLRGNLACDLGKRIQSEWRWVGGGSGRENMGAERRLGRGGRMHKGFREPRLPPRQLRAPPSLASASGQ